MPFVTEQELMAHARKNGYAVPAVFPFNFEFIKPIIEVAEEENSPIILCQGPEFIKSFGEHVFTQALITAAHYAKVPVSLSADHAFVTDDTSVPDAMRTIHLGWKSVMVDGSLLPYEDNVRYTKQLADSARGSGVAVVGALGEVKRFFPQAQNYTTAYEEGYTVPADIMTDPDKAKEFVDITGVDSLAVAVGQYVRSLWDGELPPFKKHARLNFERLDAIHAKTDIHLVLHGATHVNEEDLTRAAKHEAVSIIKVASEQALIWSSEVRKLVTENQTVMFPEDIQKPALAAMKESVRHYIRLFNANGKA